MKRKSTPSFPASFKQCWHFFLCFFLIIISVNSFAQVVKVSGTVRDNKGVAIAGVSVTIKGTELGTTTDNLGEFIINVPSAQSELIFSAVSYIQKTVSVIQGVHMNVVLADNSNDLD